MPKALQLDTLPEQALMPQRLGKRAHCGEDQVCYANLLPIAILGSACVEALHTLSGRRSTNQLGTY